MDEFYDVAYPDKEARIARIYDLETQYECFVWVTRDWRVVPITQMRESHLRNALAFQRRQLDALLSKYERGEYDDEADALEWDRRMEWAMLCESELRRRGLFYAHCQKYLDANRRMCHVDRWDEYGRQPIDAEEARDWYY